MENRKEKKTNILFVLPNFDTGGSEKLVFDIIKHIDKSKFNPVLCVFFSGAYEEEFLKLNIPFYIVHPEGKRRSKIQRVRFLNKIIRDHKIQVVNTHHTSSLLQGLLSYKFFNRSKLIHAEHTRLNFDPNVTLPILFIQKIFMKFVDVALGISQGVCDCFENDLKVKKEKIHKILNGVDIDKFQFGREEEKKLRGEYRNKLGINEHNIVIGMCANFRKQKNHPVLIKACDLLIKQGTMDFKVVLCGTGPEQEDVQAVVKEKKLENRILFLGARLDIPELMNCFDIYCLPSFFEGLPFSILEAMAAGLPVVATDVEGNSEVVKHEETGLLVESDNSDELAEALKRLIQDEDFRKKCADSATRNIQDFSFDNMMKCYENLFDCLI